MTAPAPVPLALLEGLATAWASLAGGAVEVTRTAAGTVVAWRGPDGRAEALPDRMYGLAEAPGPVVDPGALPRGLPVNLPPGVTAPGAAAHCVGHLLEAADRDGAWAALKRVGRQGVAKATRLGCEARPLDDAEYLRLAGLKAAALGGRPPHPGLPAALRGALGAGAVGLTGAAFEGVAVAAVLHVRVGAWGLLVDGASDRAHWDKCPNNLAVWEAVAALVSAGCRHVDFGFSPPGAGDLRFKAHMGGQAVTLWRVQGFGGASPGPARPLA